MGDRGTIVWSTCSVYLHAFLFCLAQKLLKLFDGEGMRWGKEKKKKIKSYYQAMVSGQAKNKDPYDLICEPKFELRALVHYLHYLDVI